MDTRKRLEKVLTTALGQSFEECPNAKKVVIQQALDTSSKALSTCPASLELPAWFQPSKIGVSEPHAYMEHTS